MAEKLPPSPRWGNFFYTGSIHLRQFPSSLGFCGRKASPLPWGWGKHFFTLDLSIWGNYPATLVFVAEKPTPEDEGNSFFTGSIHLRKFLATLIFVAEKPSHPQDKGFFLHWIYPFQAILSNFGFCDTKAPTPTKWGHFFTLDLSISGNFQQLWFLWQKSPSSPPRWGNFFYTGSIHLRQFPVTLVFVAEKPSLQDEGNFLHWIYPFEAISSSFRFLWQKSFPLPKDEGNIFLHWIYQFQAISSNFGFCGRKAPSPKRREHVFTLDLSIWGNFQQLWFFVAQKPSNPQDERIFFYTGSIHLRQFPVA